MQRGGKPAKIDMKQKLVHRQEYPVIHGDKRTLVSLSTSSKEKRVNDCVVIVISSFSLKDCSVTNSPPCGGRQIFSVLLFFSLSPSIWRHTISVAVHLVVTHSRSSFVHLVGCHCTQRITVQRNGKRQRRSSGSDSGSHRIRLRLKFFKTQAKRILRVVQAAKKNWMPP